MASMVEHKLTGVVEIDETLVGGKARSGGKGRGHGRGNRRGMTTVLGAVERGGDVRLKVVQNRNRKTLHGFADTHIDAEDIHTDDWAAYDGVGGEGTDHHVINHSADEYVVGDVHTNTIESVWSLFKRSIVGTFHKLSVKHLPAYLDETEWRFNNRDNPYIFRDTLIAVLQSETLGYEKLTAK